MFKRAVQMFSVINTIEQDTSNQSFQQSYIYQLSDAPFKLFNPTKVYKKYFKTLPQSRCSF